MRQGRLWRSCSRAISRAVSGCSRTPPSATIWESSSAFLTSCGRFCGQLAQRANAFGGARSRASGPILSDHPSLGHRPRRFPDVEIGIEAARHAFHHHHGLLQQHQLRLGLHVEAARGLEQLPQQPRHRDVAGASAEDRLADGAQGLGEGLDRMLRRHESEIVMQLRHAAIIAREEARQRFRHEAAHAGIEPAHDAEIDRHQAALARRRTDCPDACRHGKSRRAAPGSGSCAPTVSAIFLGSWPAARSASAIADRRAVDPFAGQHARRGAAPVDMRARGIRASPRVRSYSSDAAAASMRRSSSSATEAARVSTSGRSGAAAALRPRSARATRANKAKAPDRARIQRSMPGRRTFTATRDRRPSLVVARCTWAMEAAATGGAESRRTELSTGWPKRCAIIGARLLLPEKAAAGPADAPARAPHPRRQYRAASPASGRA